MATLARLDWDAKNLIKLKIKINRNTDPELYSYLKDAEGRASLIRQMLREGMSIKNSK